MRFGGQREAIFVFSDKQGIGRAETGLARLRPPPSSRLTAPLSGARIMIMGGRLGVVRYGGGTVKIAHPDTA